MVDVQDFCQIRCVGCLGVRPTSNGVNDYNKILLYGELNGSLLVISATSILCRNAANVLSQVFCILSQFREFISLSMPSILTANLSAILLLKMWVRKFLAIFLIWLFLWNVGSHLDWGEFHRYSTLPHRVHLSMRVFGIFSLCTTENCCRSPKEVVESNSLLQNNKVV